MSTVDRPGSDIVSLKLTGQDLGELEQALAQVESGKGVLVRLADLMGGAVGHAARLGLRGLGMAPTMEDKLRGLAEASIARAFDVAILGLRPTEDAAVETKAWRTPALQAAVAVSGAVGGFAGLAGLAPDIGFTTLTIMREIGRIAREEGEDLSDPDARHACLEVFALRAFPNVRQGDESELGYANCGSGFSLWACAGAESFPSAYARCRCALRGLSEHRIPESLSGFGACALHHSAA